MSFETVKNTGILLESGTNELELLEFIVGDQHYGINVAKIRELCPYQTPTPVPNSHEFIEGIFMPRDMLITVIDLSKALGMPNPGNTDGDMNIITNLSEIADMTGIMNAKQEDSKLKKLETSIDDLDFSVRAYNCLKRAGINTLGDLTEKSELEMMKIRNLGKKSLKEVIDKIKDMGLRFREED